jgi:hypothetical protein
MNEYYTFPSSILEKIKEMKLEGKSTEDIEEEVSRKNKINPEIVGYILTKEAHA